jgi:hypothetical protein
MYLIYLVLNKRKLDNKQTPIPPAPNELGITTMLPEPTSQWRHNTLCRIMVKYDQQIANGLTFIPVSGYGHNFYFIHVVILDT